MAQRDATDREYLGLVTELLQRARRAAPEAGLWEAADLQWWWRRDQHVDPDNARFWIDDHGLPIGAMVVTDYGDVVGLDVIATPEATDLALTELWPHALERASHLTHVSIETAVRDDDTATATVLGDAGFEVGDPSAMSCWMPAGERLAVPPIATGYRLLSIAERSLDPHHMAVRHGPHVAERLQECSLYRPELDLYIEGPDGDVAGYGLFWADPITGVGLVEPMRTEDRHQHKGLGRHLLCAGLERLAQHRCTRLKVTYLDDNEPARLLYLGSGFHPRTPSRTFRRAAAVP
ncbi:MAG: GNAT family N-acetyltransferase [Ilumatobacteraceae bacterium]